MATASFAEMPAQESVRGLRFATAVLADSLDHRSDRALRFCFRPAACLDHPPPRCRPAEVPLRFQWSSRTKARSSPSESLRCCLSVPDKRTYPAVRVGWLSTERWLCCAWCPPANGCSRIDSETADFYHC